MTDARERLKRILMGDTQDTNAGDLLGQMADRLLAAGVTLAPGSRSWRRRCKSKRVSAWRKSTYMKRQNQPPLPPPAPRSGSGCETRLSRYGRRCRCGLRRMAGLCH